MASSNSTSTALKKSAQVLFHRSAYKCSCLRTHRPACEENEHDTATAPAVVTASAAHMCSCIPIQQSSKHDCCCISAALKQPLNSSCSECMSHAAQLTGHSCSNLCSSSDLHAMQVNKASPLNTSTHRNNGRGYWAVVGSVVVPRGRDHNRGIKNTGQRGNNWHLICHVAANGNGAGGAGQGCP